MTSRPSLAGMAWRYLVFVGVPAAIVVLALELGKDLAAAGAASAQSEPPVPGRPLDVPLLLAQIIAVIAASRAAGWVLAKLGQPRVVGEMAAGLLLGPSILGALAPEAYGALFPAGTVRFLGALSQVGLVFFMFLVGLHLDRAHLKGRGDTAVLTSHTSISVPFALGALLALALYPRLAPAGVPFTSFALFVGAAMSVTAFPVLARILGERGLSDTPLGALAIACAAVDDVTAWSILAVIVVLARHDQAVPLWLTLGGSVAFVLVMATVVRAAAARLARHGAAPPQDAVAVVVLLVLGSALTTELLGIHAVFGAFLAGAVLPRDPAFRRALTDRFEDVMVVLLLPLFFAVTGLTARVGLIAGAAWLLALGVLVVAVAGKLGGTALAARSAGSGWREALSLGVLMNTRGLMELVILRVGLDIGVIGYELFTMMVLMALVTTFMTTPLLALLAGRSVPARP